MFDRSLAVTSRCRLESLAKRWFTDVIIESTSNHVGRLHETMIII